MADIDSQAPAVWPPAAALRPRASARLSPPAQMVLSAVVGAAAPSSCGVCGPSLATRAAASAYIDGNAQPAAAIDSRHGGAMLVENEARDANDGRHDLRRTHAYASSSTTSAPTPTSPRRARATRTAEEHGQ